MISNPLVSEEQQSTVSVYQCFVNEVIMKRGGDSDSWKTYAVEFEVDFFQEVDLLLSRIYPAKLCFCGTIYECKVQPRFMTSYHAGNFVVKLSAIGPIQTWRDYEDAVC